MIAALMKEVICCAFGCLIFGFFGFCRWFCFFFVLDVLIPFGEVLSVSGCLV